MRTGLLLIAVCLAGAVSAQSYSVSSGALSSSYTDLSSPTTTSLGLGQLTNAVSPTGFNFTYFGQSYTSFRLGSGGYMIMGSSGTVISRYAQHSTSPGLVISPLWDYLEPGARLMPQFSSTLPAPGHVAYQYAGGVLAVEWRNVPRGNDSATGVRMKVLLDTSNGQIEFQYGDVPTNTSGSTVTDPYTCAISGPTATSPQEIIPGTTSGYVNNDGSVSTYPANQFIRFTPGSTPSNNPPTLVVAQGSSVLANNSTINVNYNDTVSGLNLQITASDTDNDPISVSANITNIGATGIVQTQWESASATGPYSIAPTSGTFNTVAGVTHVVTLTANDGTANTVFTLNIVQAAQPATPSISVSDGSTITAGQAAAGTNRAFGDLVVGTGPSAALTITITNNGGATLTLSGFAVSGDSGEFVVDTTLMTSTVAASGGSTTFTIAFNPTSTGAKTATISFNHDDTSVANPFTFEITGNGTTSTPGPGPTPISGGGGGGGGGCVAGSGANFVLLLLIAMSACLGARTLRHRVLR